MGGHNDDCVPCLQGILASGHDNAAVAVNACHQQVIPGPQLLQRNPQYRRISPHPEFQSLGLVGHDFIQCLYVAAHGVLHGPYILQYDVGCQHLGVYDAPQVQGVDYIFKGYFINLGDQLGPGLAGCI